MLDGFKDISMVDLAHLIEDIEMIDNELTLTEKFSVDANSEHTSYGIDA